MSLLLLYRPSSYFRMEAQSGSELWIDSYLKKKKKVEEPIDEKETPLPEVHEDTVIDKSHQSVVTNTRQKNYTFDTFFETELKTLSLKLKELEANEKRLASEFKQFTELKLREQALKIARIQMEELEEEEDELMLLMHLLS